MDYMDYCYYYYYYYYYDYDYDYYNIRFCLTAWYISSTDHCRLGPVSRRCPKEALGDSWSQPLQAEYRSRYQPTVSEQ